MKRLPILLIATILMIAISACGPLLTYPSPTPDLVMTDVYATIEARPTPTVDLAHWYRSYSCADRSDPGSGEYTSLENRAFFTYSQETNEVDPWTDFTGGDVDIVWDSEAQQATITWGFNSITDKPFESVVSTDHTIVFRQIIGENDQGYPVAARVPYGAILVCENGLHFIEQQ